MKHIQLLLVLFIICTTSLTAGNSSSYNGLYNKYTKYYAGIDFTVYDFSRAKGSQRVKAKYFAQNAYTRFQNWSKSKDVVLVCAGAFSTSWDADATPIGLCVDNGVTVNRTIHSRDSYGNQLDGLVVVYGGGADQGGIAIKDIEQDEICVSQGISACYDIQNSSTDRYYFTNWAEEQNATVFQLPLLYTSTHGKNYGSDYYGSKKERRYLAICIDSWGTVRHLVIDTEDKVYMNYCASKIVSMLSGMSYKTIGLMNLDKGGKDILYEYSNGYAYKMGGTDMSKATNLLIYYID